MAMYPEAYMNLCMEECVQDTIGSVHGVAAANRINEAYSPNRYNGDAVPAFSQLNCDFYIRLPAREYTSITAGVVTCSVFLNNFAHFSHNDPVVHYGLYDSVNTYSSSLAHLTNGKSKG